jgi:hypothetical protein
MISEPDRLRLMQVPAELRNLKRWVCWRYEQRGKRRTKVLYDPIKKNKASSTDPDTWWTFEVVLCALEETDLYRGIGCIIAAPYVAIDLDKVRDATTGDTEDWAAAIIEEVNSYTELSPSGTGFHIWCKGTLPEGTRRCGRIEMYNEARYFTVTGRKLATLPNEIREVDLASLHSRIGLLDPVKPEEKKVAEGVSANADLDEMLAGNWGQWFNSQSEADLSALTKLAIKHWVDEDEDATLNAVIGEFEASAMMRPKFNEDHYRVPTLRKALEGARRIISERLTDEEMTEGELGVEWMDPLVEAPEPRVDTGKVVATLTAGNKPYTETGAQQSRAIIEDMLAQPAPEPVAAVAEQPAAGKPKGIHEVLVFPEAALYGWCGEWARRLETPLGFAYPAMLTAFAPCIRTYAKEIRGTLYTALLGPPHCGKSETIDRALAIIRYPEENTAKRTVPGSDRGLINIFGGKAKGDKKNDPNAVPVHLQTAKPRLLVQDELANTLSKACIQNSSLPATLCSLFYKDEAGASDKTGEHIALMKLSILGALKCDDPEDFTEVFGKRTTGGLYDRFLFCIGDKDWKYGKWMQRPAEPDFRGPGLAVVTPEAERMCDEWVASNDKLHARLGELAMRIAYISASANHDKVITVPCIQAALVFADWQVKVREKFVAGVGEGVDALATNAIINALSKSKGEWFRWKELALKKNWYRKFGARVLTSTRDALSKGGITTEEMEYDESGRGSRTGRLMIDKEKPVVTQLSTVVSS